MSATCPIHDLPWKTVPAGVSKTTGKPYGSFQCCPFAGCKERPKDNPAARPASAPASTNGHTTPQHLLVLASLDFASKVFQGTAQGDDAMQLAADCFARFKVAL